MALSRQSWSRILAGLSILNLAGMWYAMRVNEPRHALIHVVLAAGFGLWAWRLKLRPSEPNPLGLQDQVEQQAAALEDAQAALADQSAQLAELQERLDFAERILAQSRDRPSLGVREERGDPPQ
jgi:hypothetical protein